MTKKINIVIPLAGSNPLFPIKDFPFSKHLVEIDGKPMIQLAIENLQKIKRESHFIFLVDTQDCKTYFLDNVLRLLTEEDEPTIIKVDHKTKGATCTTLLAIDNIDNDIPLIISNGDQIIMHDLNKIINYFENYDVGVVSTPSVHPRWSYIRTDGKLVIETAEKRPISKKAIAGLFYYKMGSYFVKSAMQTIMKEANYNDMYYISSTINELILNNKNVGYYEISSNQYESFYSPEKIMEYNKRR